MAYEEEAIVQDWLDHLKGLDVHVKKMFGCYCLYCDGEAVGWIHDSVLSLREVLLDYLPEDIRRPGPADKVQELVIPFDYIAAEWLPKAVQDTARIRKREGEISVCRETDMIEAWEEGMTMTGRSGRALNRMTAEEMWKESGLSGTYTAWPFGEVPDKLAALVVRGVKTATCSAYELYELNNEPLPQAGEYSIILDSAGEAVCIIQTVKVTVTEFKNVSEAHAFKEGEGDRTLTYWREVHELFLRNELASVRREFDENTKVVCEEFEVVYQ